MSLTITITDSGCTTPCCTGADCANCAIATATLTIAGYSDTAEHTKIGQKRGNAGLGNPPGTACLVDGPYSSDPACDSFGSLDFNNQVTYQGLASGFNGTYVTSSVSGAVATWNLGTAGSIVDPGILYARSTYIRWSYEVSGTCHIKKETYVRTYYLYKLETTLLCGYCYAEDGVTVTGVNFGCSDFTQYHQTRIQYTKEVDGSVVASSDTMNAGIDTGSPTFEAWCGDLWFPVLYLVGWMAGAADTDCCCRPFFCDEGDSCAVTCSSSICGQEIAWDNTFCSYGGIPTGAGYTLTVAA
jgi:hypothetical protein